jgi:hypothetical protein
MEKTVAEDVAEKVRPLVNDILERFNQESITPQEAAFVVLALAHRLLTVLDGKPEEQKGFIFQIVNLINTYLSGKLNIE